MEKNQRRSVRKSREELLENLRRNTRKNRVKLLRENLEGTISFFRSSKISPGFIPEFLPESLPELLLRILQYFHPEFVRSSSRDFFRSSFLDFSEFSIYFLAFCSSQSPTRASWNPCDECGNSSRYFSLWMLKCILAEFQRKYERILAGLPRRNPRNSSKRIAGEIIPREMLEISAKVLAELWRNCAKTSK